MRHDEALLEAMVTRLGVRREGRAARWVGLADRVTVETLAGDLHMRCVGPQVWDTTVGLWSFRVTRHPIEGTVTLVQWHAQDCPPPVGRVVKPSTIRPGVVVDIAAICELAIRDVDRLLTGRPVVGVHPLIRDRVVAMWLDRSPQQTAA